ncbi:hypothetical protein ACSEOQ_12605 [Pseudomonas aeruginosa]
MKPILLDKGCWKMSADFACFSLYGQRWSIARHGHRGGHPLLLHHDLLGDGHVHPDWVSLADAHGVEMIVIERPGYGGTPPCGMRAIADWPGLVAPLLAQLGIASRFDVLGISAGMPGRVGLTLLLGGVPFVDHPEVLACYPASSQAAYAGFAASEEQTLRNRFATWCHSITARLDDDGRMAPALSAIEAHGFAGPAREARLQALPWGVAPQAIRGPVHAWHVREDDQVPFAAVAHSLSLMPNAHLHVQTEPSHMPSLETGRDVFALLAAHACAS